MSEDDRPLTRAEAIAAGRFLLSWFLVIVGNVLMWAPQVHEAGLAPDFLDFQFMDKDHSTAAFGLGIVLLLMGIGMRYRRRPNQGPDLYP